MCGNLEEKCKAFFKLLLALPPPQFFFKKSVSTYGQEIINLQPFVDWSTHQQLTKMAQIIF